MENQSNSLKLKKRIVWLLVFSIAMAYLESAVVVYLREIYYPEGFEFPLSPIHAHILITEIWREVATIVMLVGISVLTGRSGPERFAFFLVAFAIWDIFYYVFLYVLLGWPASLFTWDILFLIPLPWVGPVISPIIVSLIMILMASSIIYFKKNLNRNQWFLAILGSQVVIISWVLDYYNFHKEHFSEIGSIFFSSHELIEGSKQYIPESFNWYIFFLGISILLLSIALYYLKNRKEQK